MADNYHLEMLEEARFIVESPFYLAFVIICGLVAGKSLSISVYDIFNTPDTQLLSLAWSMFSISTAIQGVYIWQTEYNSTLYACTLCISSIVFIARRLYNEWIVCKKP